MSERQREALAEYAHEAWSRWMRHVFSKAEFNDQDQAVLSADEVRRWQRQIATPYMELSNSEKESDRREADCILTIINAK